MSLTYRLFQLCTIFIPIVIGYPAAQAEQSSVTNEPEPNEAPSIFIGHNPAHPYVIIIPSLNNDQDDQNIDRVRSQLAQIRDKIASTGQVPFIAKHTLGRYIHVCNFPQRHQAEAALKQILKDESRARLVYFP